MRGDARNWLVCMALALLVLASYWPVLGGYFLSDDAIVGMVFRDGGGVNWSHVARTFAGDWRRFDGAEIRYFRPLVIVTQAIDARLWGLKPFGFHLTNVLLHALVGFALYRLALRVGASTIAAIAAAVLFVVQPLHGESVAWISGRTDLVAAIPTLASLSAFLWYRQSARVSALALSLAAYGLALLAKEPAVAVPGMVVALDFGLPRRAPERHENARTFLPLLGFGALTLAYVWWRKRVFGDVSGGLAPSFYAAPEGNVTRVWTDLTGNLELFFFPYNRQSGNQHALAWGSSLALALFAVALFGNLLSRRLPWRRMGAVVLAFFASIAPIASNMKIHDNLNGTRMWYLPATWLCLLVAMVCVQRPRGFTRACVLGQIGAALVVLRINLLPWKEAGETMGRIREVYAQAFGTYDGERIRDLPTIDRGAHLALYNAELFDRPFVRAKPRPEQRARFDAVYRPSTRAIEVVRSEAWQTCERLDRELQNAVWLWQIEGAPFEQVHTENGALRELLPDRAVFEAHTNDVWLSLPTDREIAPPESTDQRETAYLLLRPAPRDPPELFWIDSRRQNWSGDRMVGFEPELTLQDGQVVQRHVDGHAVYSARLDTHPRWRGLDRVRGIRLDPTQSPGQFSISYFNISRELRGLR